MTQERFSIGALREEARIAATSKIPVQRVGPEYAALLLALVEAVEAAHRHGHRCRRIVKHAGDMGVCRACEALARFDS